MQKCLIDFKGLHDISIKDYATFKAFLEYPNKVDNLGWYSEGSQDISRTVMVNTIKC